MSIFATEKLISEARRLAAEYRRAMGKPLGISAEIAEFDAARLLDLELCNPRQGGYDAIGRGPREGRRIQIKGRAVFDEKKGNPRIGQLKLDQEWDSVMLVIMDENYEPVEIYEADRATIEEDLARQKNSKRAKRGAMSVARFKALAKMVWNCVDGVVDDDAPWENRPT